MLAHETLAQLRTQFDFQPVGQPVGNLTLGKGTLRGQPLHMALVENRNASGALGAKESDRLASLFKVIAAKQAPLVMYLDSAGAKVSEGLPALGAFRHMYRAALAMAESGAPTAVFCGANCYGGASMLASLAGTRYYSRNTRLAMSGPAILAQTAGVSVLDEMFQAVSLASIGADARIKLPGNLAVSPSAMSEELPRAATSGARHAELGARLAQIGNGAGNAAPEKIERKDLDKLYPQGYTLHEQQGVLRGEAVVEGSTVAVVGLIGGKLLGAARAWTLADLVWARRASPPRTLHLLIDCESHATTLDDERVMLSAYLANLSCA
ncbi:MAG: biotin-independent malonate decarboxylase subunit gamma, partial [Betaproteobacteria bacterium]